MPNFAAALKEEIIRLARREIKSQVLALKKSSAQYRRQIAALKRHGAKLQSEVGRMAKRSVDNGKAREDQEQPPKGRFSARSVVAQRKRLGLSAADFGKLVGVTGATIYAWEQGRSRARTGQLAALGEVRGIGKRQAKERLGTTVTKASKKKASKKKAAKGRAARE